MFARMVLMARGVAEFMRDSEYYDWLPEPTANLDEVQIIVLFRAKNDALNDVLVQKINDTRKMYVSGTQWQGKKACRLAVSSWRVDAAKDLPVVKDILTTIATQSSS